MSATYIGQAVYEWADGENTVPGATVSRFGGIFVICDFVGVFRQSQLITLEI